MCVRVCVCEERRDCAKYQEVGHVSGIREAPFACDSFGQVTGPEEVSVVHIKRVLKEQVGLVHMTKGLRQKQLEHGGKRNVCVCVFTSAT